MIKKNIHKALKKHRIYLKLQLRTKMGLILMSCNYPESIKMINPTLANS
jgi:hypothetical protein